MGKKRKVKNAKKTIPENQETVRQSAIQAAEREIYENITQCLCLARLQLGNINFDNKEQSLAFIGEANLLIGKAVKDLRNLAKQLTTNP